MGSAGRGRHSLLAAGGAGCGSRLTLPLRVLARTIMSSRFRSSTCNSQLELFESVFGLPREMNLWCSSLGFNGVRGVSGE